jgi:hypothetical protein
VIRGVSEYDEEIHIRLFISSPPCHGTEEFHAIDSQLFGDPLLRCLQNLVNMRRKRKVLQSFMAFSPAFSHRGAVQSTGSACSALIHHKPDALSMIIPSPSQYRRGTEAAKTVCAVSAGAEWSQGVVNRHWPEASRRLEFPHAVGSVAHAGQAVDEAGYGRPAARGPVGEAS